MKTISLHLLTLCSAVFLGLSCQSPGKSSKDTTTVIQLNETKDGQPAILGHYADAGYANRGEGSDWVGVIISDAGKDKIHVSIRSRSDIKRPTCTFDALAHKVDRNTYRITLDGNTAIVKIDDDTLTIAPQSPKDEGMLSFYCSGGASLEGTYSRIDGELDPMQVDPTIFAKVLRLQGIGFNVTSIKKDGKVILAVFPFGLKNDNREFTMPISGRVVDAEVEDMNADGSPELLVYTQSDDAKRYGNVVAFSVNNLKSMSMVAFPAVADNPKINSGYQGHDEFRMVENNLVQRFPLFKDGDKDDHPTGGTRQVSYELKDGEAMRQLVIKDISEH